VFVVAFLVFSPVSKLVFPESVDVSEARVLSGDRADTPIVMVVFDEFPAGALMNRNGTVDATRYPHFARLARRSTWYRNATSVSGATTIAVPAIMDGQMPGSGRLPIASDHPGSLFTLLGRSYEMDVTEPATSVCPSELCGERSGEGSVGDRLWSLASDLSVVSLHQLLPERFRSHLPAVDRTFGNFRGAGRNAPGSGPADIPADVFSDRAQKWAGFVSGIREDGAKPGLHFFHAAFPHVPWQFLPTGQRYVVAGDEVPGLENENWTDDAALVDTAAQRFKLQVGYVDRLLGSLEARLRRTGLWNRALVVVTADHGVSFRPGQPRRGISREHPADIANVPLFFRLPGQRRGQIDDASVRTIDIVPTIADYLGLKPDWEPDGRSFLNAPPRAAAAPLNFESVSFTRDELERSRAETVNEMIRLFGAGDGGAALYAIGGDSDLLDRSTRSLPQAGEVDRVEVELDQSSLLGDVNPGKTLLPAYLSGTISGDVSDVHRVAIAMNGRVRAIAPTHHDGAVARFAAAVPAQALRRGANTVEVLALREVSGRRELARLGRVAGETYALREQGGKTVITSAGRAPIPVVSGSAEGNVDGVDLGQGAIFGWAVDPKRHVRADRVLAFVDGVLVAGGPTGGDRSDLSEPLGPWATKAGFRLSVGGEGGFDAGEVRVFAVVGGRAAEISGG
jgi:hypothetical protein